MPRLALLLSYDGDGGLLALLHCDGDGGTGARVETNIVVNILMTGQGGHQADTGLLEGLDYF